MITISKPKPIDAEGINEVIKQSWYATYITPEIGITKEDIDAMYSQNEVQQIETFRKRAESPKENDITLVAKENDHVVGIIRLLILDDHIRVRTMYIHPEFTGKGIGTMLWNEAQKYIPSDKNVIAFPAEYTKSIGWYKKMGFIETGEKKVDDEAMPISGVHLKTIKMQLTRDKDM
ncbi:MAG: GNAT family N-acetyltransferase [bacterium]